MRAVATHGAHGESPHERWMRLAISEAHLARAHGDVPVGAVVVHDGAVIAQRHNERERTQDPTAHAELLAIHDAAAALARWRLDDCTVVVTLEPCVMCAGALAAARVGAVVFGTPDLRYGALGSRYHVLADPRLNHSAPVTSGLLADECAALLQDFFADRRA